MEFLEFSVDGRSYRADVRQAVGTPAGHPRKAWFVAVDGAREVRAFQAHWRDLDTRQFRRRLVAAAHRWANTGAWSTRVDESAQGD